MKAYKKLMDMLAFAEEVVLVLSTAVILVLTVGNVFPEKSSISPGHLRKNWLLPYLS